VIAPQAASAPPAPPQPQPRVAAVAAITSVNDCKPDYPAAALKEEATGTTKIRFTIDASGKMTGAEVLKSAGASRAHKALDRAAVSGLGECKFRPGRDENGKAVGAFADVEYVWKLE
jgi:protein TonB